MNPQSHVFVALIVLTIAASAYATSNVNANCILGQYGNATGIVTFNQPENGGPTTILGIIAKVTPGLHGWHIHELGITDPEDPCGSAGGHFNPDGVNHGAPDAAVRHVGDLGNFEANSYGFGFVFITDNLVSLVGPPERSVLGRTLVIHGGEDDLGLGGDEGSLASGNSGPRVGCCVIMET